MNKQQLTHVKTVTHEQNVAHHHKQINQSHNMDQKGKKVMNHKNGKTRI